MLVLKVTDQGEFNTKLHDQADIMGICIPRPNETLAETYVRAEQVRQAVLAVVDPSLVERRRHQDFEPLIAVVSLEQIALWGGASLKNMNLLPTAYREHAVNPVEVVEILTACLEKLGFQDDFFFRGYRVEGGEIEIFIVDKQGNPAPLDILGVKHIANGKKHTTTEWVEQVIGLKCFEASIPDSQRLSITRSFMLLWRSRSISPEQETSNVKIFAATPEIVKIWLDHLACGENPVRLSQSAKTDTPPSPELKHIGSSVTSVTYKTYEKGKPGIGAKPSWIVVEHIDGHTEWVTLDFGSQREDYLYNSQFGPSIEQGMAPFRELLPTAKEIPSFYSLTLLLKSAASSGAAFLSDIQNNDDLFDLYIRLTSLDFQDMVRQLDPSLIKDEVEALVKQLELLRQSQPKLEQVRQICALISHFHDDHTGFFALVGSHIPQALLAESAPWREIFFYKGPWMKEVSIRRQRATLINEKSDRHYSPPQHVFEPYETKFIGRRVSVTALPCDHSIYGASMFLISVFDDFGLPLHKVLYTGDFRFRDTGLTEKSVEVLETLGGVDTVITETTNVKRNSHAKTSQRVTKEKLHDTYDSLFKQTQDKNVIILLDPKDLGLLSLIHEHAATYGREIIHSIKHAEVMELFRSHDAATQFRKQTPRHQRTTADLLRVSEQDHWLWQEPLHLLDYHPRPQLGPNNKVFLPQKQSLGQLEKWVVFEHPELTVTRADLPSQNNFVLLLSPTSTLEEQLANIAEYFGKTTVVRAHYFTYQEHDRDIVRRDAQFCQKLGWQYFSDLQLRGYQIASSETPRFRMSGHSTEADFIGFMEKLLVVNPDMKIIPVHGQARQYVGEAITQAFGDKVSVVTKMTKNGFNARLY